MKGLVRLICLFCFKFNVFSMESVPELYIKDIVLTDGSKDYTTSYAGKDKVIGNASQMFHKLSKRGDVKFFYKTDVDGTAVTEQFVSPKYPSCSFDGENKIKVEDAGVYVHLYVDKSLPIKAGADGGLVSLPDNYKCHNFEPLRQGDALKDYIDEIWNSIGKSHVVEGNDFIVEVEYLNNSRGGAKTVCTFEEAQSSKNLCGGWIKIYYKPKNGSSQSGNNSSSQSDNNSSSTSKSKCCCKK